jgi:translocation and assembly module TamB
MMPRRALQLLAGVLLSSLVLSLTLVALLLALNTEPGRRLLAQAIHQASDGRVLIDDLSGWMPFAPRVGRLALRDSDGVWLTVQDAALSVDAGALTRGELAISALTAGSVGIVRLPARDNDAASGVSVPMPIALRRLRIETLDLGQVVPDAPPLTIDGSARYQGSGDAAAAVLLTIAERSDRYRLNLIIRGGQIGLELAVRESAGGPLSRLAEARGLRLPPSLSDWRLDAAAAGPPAALALHARLSAGPVAAALDGLIDLDSRDAVQLHLAANASELRLATAAADGIGWQRLAIRADLSGPLASPRGSARVEADGLSAGDLGLDARLQVDGLLEQQSSLGVRGEIALTRAPEPLAALVGPAAQVSLLARKASSGWWIDAGTIETPILRGAVRGMLGADVLGLGWTLGLAEISRLAPGWSGRVDAQGRLTGSPRAAELIADWAADFGAELGLSADPEAPVTGQLSGQLTGRLSAHLDAQMAAPRGRIDLSGTLAGQPLSVALQAGRAADAGWVLVLDDSRWASVSAAGRLRLPAGAVLPQAEARLRVKQLADLGPPVAALAAVLGRLPLDQALTESLAGRLDLQLKLTDRGIALLDLDGQSLRLPASVEAEALSLRTRITDPTGVADTTATLQLRGLSRGDLAGDLSLNAAGPVANLELDANARLTTPLGPAGVAATARLDSAARRLTLERLTGTAADEGLRLLQPATLDFAEGLAVDRLRLALGRGTVVLNGRLSPRLDLEAAISDLPLEPLRALAPALAADSAPEPAPDLAPERASRPAVTGTLNAQARLTGTPSAPVGTLSAEASGVRLTIGPGRGLAPAKLRLTTSLNPTDTEIDLRAEAGESTNLRLRGRVAGPLAAPGALTLTADGRVDLALFNPLLNAAGRQTAGQLLLDASVGGSVDAPRLDGRLRFIGAALSDLRLGINLNEVAGVLTLSGEELRIERLTGRAGDGSVELTGSLGILTPELPVDLRLTAERADLVQLDRLDVNADADLTLRGLAGAELSAAGSIRFGRLDIRLPERLPANIATLEVRERGTPRRQRVTVRAPAFQPRLLFDLLLSAPRTIRVLGRGVDAELGGELRLRGSLQQPEVTGGFDLVRGEYSLVGKPLRFTRGRIAFEGAAGFEPTLDLEARVNAAGSTAILAVLGTPNAPRIELRGEPELPPDEVLSRLLFGTASGRLSAWQIARIGLAATSLTGIESGGPGMLERIRGGLGLGRLSIGEDQRGDLTLEAGRRLSERVYLGARQGTRAGETQGVLRLDATPRIRLETDIGASGGARAGAAFELEY